MPATDAKKAQLKQRFREMDKNKDGMLDFNEFLDLMQGLDTRTAHKLFEKCDTSGDGTISFDEFVDYIYETEKSRAGRTTEGRHARLRAMNEVSAESEDAGLWDRCQSVFDTYQGMDEKFEGKDLKKLCIDCKLFDRKFTKNDVDIVFAKHKTKGKNFIGFPEFQNCVRGIAQKKGVPTKVVQVAVSEREDVGIQQNATQADFVSQPMHLRRRLPSLLLPPGPQALLPPRRQSIWHSEVEKMITSHPSLGRTSPMSISLPRWMR